MASGITNSRPLLGALLTALAASALVAGCGSSGDSTAATGDAARPDASAFPAPDGRTLEQIATDEGSESKDVVLPTGSVYNNGDNRYGFGVFTIDNKPIRDAEVAVYAAQPGQPAVGPFPAAVEDLAVGGAFQSVTTSSDPDAAEAVYVSDVELDGKGEWQMLALLKDGDSYTYTAMPSSVVNDKNQVPAVGDQAPVIHTDTPADVGGDVTKIDTRQPPSTMHEDDFADVVGKEPVVLLFATPALCQSRVCGPVADIAEQVKSERGDQAAFIMQEIYKDNEVNKGLRPQVQAYNLQTEPWLFVIDANGKISTEIEGAFSEGELNAALDKATGNSSS